MIFIIQYMDYMDDIDVLRIYMDFTTQYMGYYNYNNPRTGNPY